MGTPAVGQQINFTQVYNFFTGSNPSGGSNIQLRGTLGALRQPAITTGPIRLSADLGNQNITYNVTASAGSASEGSTITFYINTLYVPNNTTLYYTLANVNTRDLDASQSTFANTSYTTSGATGYASIVNKAYLRLLGRYTDSGSIDYWVNNFLQNNYVSLSAFFADLTGSNEYLSYQSTPTETGTVTVNNANASKSFLIVPDYLTEGTESVTFQVRTDSHSGTLVGSAIVNLTDTYQDEGSPTINSFSTSATSVYVNNTVTLSWTTSNTDVVRIYKNGSVYKAFNASTTSVVETISSDCNFTIYAWNGTNSTTGSTISITAVQPTSAWYNILSISGSNGTQEAGPVNQYWRRYLLAFTYTAAEITAATGKSSGTIQKLRFYVSGVPSNQPYPNWAIGLKNHSNGDGNANPGYDGYTVVRSAGDASFSAGYNEYDITDFNWNGQNLAIVFAWGMVPIGYTSTGQSYKASSGNTYGARSDSPGQFTINVDTYPENYSGRPAIELYI